MVGQTIGKYRVVSRLGRGGMGTVYKAVDETLEREVAIKCLNPDLAEPEVLKRFRAEAITLARLNHPNIATLFELTEHDGQLLMVMEFVRGETFDKRVAAPRRRCRSIAPSSCAAQVLDALAHAHRAGIVHRDLKPANLMLTESGLVKVMDFGLARMAGTEHLTNDGYMVGTPAYMSPEQVLGGEIDGRADLYAMGVVLYRLLTGQLPFKADSGIAMVQKQIHDPPTPVRQLRTELPCGGRGHPHARPGEGAGGPVSRPRTSSRRALAIADIERRRAPTSTPHADVADRRCAPARHAPAAPGRPEPPTHARRRRRRREARPAPPVRGAASRVVRRRRRAAATDAVVTAPPCAPRAARASAGCACWRCRGRSAACCSPPCRRRSSCCARGPRTRPARSAPRRIPRRVTAAATRASAARPAAILAPSTPSAASCTVSTGCRRRRVRAKIDAPQASAKSPASTAPAPCVRGARAAAPACRRPRRRRGRVVPSVVTFGKLKLLVLDEGKGTRPRRVAAPRRGRD